MQIPQPKMGDYSDWKAQGHPGHENTDWFEGLTIVLEDNGDTLWCIIVSSTST